MTGHGNDHNRSKRERSLKGEQGGIKLEGVYYDQRHVTYPDKDVVM